MSAPVVASWTYYAGKRSTFRAVATIADCAMVGYTSDMGTLAAREV
jgi:hypothetical protein